MSVRTSYERRVQSSGQGDIGAELRAAIQETIVLKPGQSGADSELAQDKLLAIERSRSG
jgi:hypothetical protein